ncbi:MAG: hypothetical protein Q9191_005987 [Dirinaria sp. TL-2023a]
MFAAQDQENLVHGHQQTAAAKPLNQGSRQLAPKTPGNKAPKTPFKLPSNDENGPGPFGGGKSSLRINGRGNENGTTKVNDGWLGGKDAFKTPMGPRNRAPLGLKTTNAKTTALHIAPPPPVENAADKGQQKTASASARKSRPRVSHAEMTKLDSVEDLDKLKEMDIEYMPPPAKNLPDYPDDIHETDLTPFPDGKGFMRGWWGDTLNKPDAEGLSYLQRQELELKRRLELEEREEYARVMRDMETPAWPCECEIECTGDTCQRNLEGKRIAEENYRKRMAEIHPERKANGSEAASVKPGASKALPKKTVVSKGPSSLASRSAANALSQKASSTNSKPTLKQSKPNTKPRLPFSNIASRKKTPPPTNPSPMRHTASTLASKSTIGRSAGRAASATYRRIAAPPKGAKPLIEVPDTSLPPDVYIARYGEPRTGSRMWMRCYEAGCFKDDRSEGPASDLPSLDEILREGADEDFVLEL